MTLVLGILAAVALVFIVLKMSLWSSDRKVERRAKYGAVSGAGAEHYGSDSSVGSNGACDVASGGDCGGGGD
jgi:hypothetical protein